MPRWTKEQQAAIDARNHTILVSAAAGSGKTAVLVERIVGLVREGYRLDRMLIVTFTRAAAAEMRQRLNQRMMKEAASDPARMAQALDELESAEISTIHAFCQKVIKNDFQAVGVDPMARICDEQQRQTLFQQAFCDAMNQLLADEQQADFQAFADCFEQAEIQDMTDRLHTFLMSLPEPFAWLEEKISQVNQQPYDEHPWYQVLAQQSGREIQGIDVFLSMQDSMFSDANAVPELRNTWQQDVDAFNALMNMDIGTPSALYFALKSYPFPRAAICKGLTDEQKEWKKQYTSLRDQIKKLVRDNADKLRMDETSIARELTVMQQHLRGLAALVKSTHQYFAAYKQQLNLLDFSDLEQMTLEILRQKEYQARLQQDYDHIFVDECQDVSAVQDAILQAIHGENSCLFMVGDVKQSIYRFRLADPTLFLQRMRTYSDNENARERRIFLQKNFRSRNHVLDATNRVFRKTMQADVTELDYLPEDELVPGRETENDPPVEIHLLNTSQEDMTDLAAESRVVVQRVKFLLTQSLEDGGTRRPYQYRDMVILLPKVTRTGAALAELLQQQGVPVYFDGAESYFGLPEIRTITGLLSVLDNPMQDVPLLSTLKMTPFSMTDQELADIRLCKTGRDVPFHVAFRAACQAETPIGARCRRIADTLGEWRFQAETMPVKDFVWYILRESGFYATCGALPEGQVRQANLRLLCQRAAEYEENGGATLSGFLKQIDVQQQAGDSRSAKLLGEGENLVRIMTIHKSKGLEFPVVFCLQMNSRLHLNRRAGLKMHSRLGVCLPYVNREMNIRRETMGDDAFDIQRLLDEKAERARLLYVAMTRARERLILVGCAQEQITWKMPVGAYRIWHASSMLDWVMQAVKDEQSTGYPQPSNPFAIRVWNDFAQQAVEKNRLIHSLANWLKSVVSVQAVEKMGIDWSEAPQARQIAPLKTSVSSLAKQQVLHDLLPLSAADEEAEDKRQPEDIVAPLRLSELPSRPAFMEDKQLTGAQRGTVVHRVLSLVHLEPLQKNLQEGLWQELNRLQESGCITKEESDMASHAHLLGFYQSDIGQRMLHSHTIRREWSFNLQLEGNTLLQGVIDCAFLEDDHWVLVDYKTDRIQDEEAFIQRYAMQLEWYARALERITGRPVAEMWLYALGKGKAYAVARQ